MTAALAAPPCRHRLLLDEGAAAYARSAQAERLEK